MTRVQELGRLCRYPGTSEADTLQDDTGNLQGQVERVYTYACKEDVRLDMQTCRPLALAMSEAAKNVFAYVTWMGMSKARQSSQEHFQRLCDLVRALALQVMIAMP